jgi:DCN1-like protein 1/2
MLAVAFELGSPRIGEWDRKGWTNGWKRLGYVSLVPHLPGAARDESVSCDTMSGMKTVVARLRHELATDPNYFQQVYTHTFDFARGEGQRSLGLSRCLDSHID